MIKLNGKVALVTGASKGIGKGIASQLAARQAFVMIADIDEHEGQKTAHALNKQGLNTAFSYADIVSEKSISAAVSATIKQFGGLDILVNNAGVNLSYDLTQMTAAAWDKAMAIDLKGAWLCAKHSIPEMLKRGAGVVINIASVHANMTTYHVFPYAIAKSGLLGLTRHIALDWGEKGIRAVTVSPGWVLSDAVQKAFEANPELKPETIKESIPAKFIAEPDDIGHLVAFLVSEEARYITGTEIVIDGGLSSRFALS